MNIDTSKSTGYSSYGENARFPDSLAWQHIEKICHEGEKEPEPLRPPRPIPDRGLPPRSPSSVKGDEIILKARARLSDSLAWQHAKEIRLEGEKESPPPPRPPHDVSDHSATPTRSPYSIFEKSIPPSKESEENS